MNHLGTFPFGQPVKPVYQTDRSPKRVFVLGVYASAVHAKWIDSEGRQKVRALAVASEPYIFWRGDGVEEIIEKITIPIGAGELLPADKKMNGPSGLTLDEMFLEPLGIKRKDVWLCDLVPHSCVNPGQQEAIEREYLPLMSQFDLPTPSVPPVPDRFATTQRQEEVLMELLESRAEILILLGDQPIKWFLNRYLPPITKLSQFGDIWEKYGRIHKVDINNKSVDVLPLAHPRQVGALGLYSPKWRNLHNHWLNETATNLLQ